MRRRGILAVGFVILAAAFPAAASTPVDVVATDASEVLPAASTTYLAWTVEIISENNFSSTVFGKELGTDTVFRVNPKGVDAASGGIEGSTLVYEQVGDIALFDPATETPLDVPDGVNTNAQEYGPSISGSRLLFGRSRRAGTSIVLFDTTTGTSQVLQRFPRASGHSRAATRVSSTATTRCGRPRRSAGEDCFVATYGSATTPAGSR
jgi:hypothetical protein